MMSKKSSYEKGKSYEDFVKEVYQAILDAEANAGIIQRIKLEALKELECKSGANTKVDIYWEYKIADIAYKTVIECKNYKDTVAVKHLREFSQKLSDIGGVRGLFVAKNGFQEGAIKVAKQNNIKLINLRELEDKDWEGCIKEIHLNMNIQFPANITNVDFKLDKEWAQNNGFKIGDKLEFNAPNNEIIIEDKTKKFKTSLYDLENTLSSDKAGNHLCEIASNDCWLNVQDKKYKVDKIGIEYQTSNIGKTEFHVDLSKFTLAILEFVDENKKFTILKDGTKKEFIP